MKLPIILHNDIILIVGEIVMAILKVDNLSYRYGNSKQNTLNHISLDLNNGQIVGLLGPNGSGKTTILKIIAGLLKNIEGNILIDNQNVSTYTKSIISYLPDSLYLNEKDTIKDSVSFFKDMYKDFDENTMYELLDKMNIDSKTTIKKLSKGNKEKVQLALCLSRKAKIYILDEPIGGVDPANREFLLNTIFTTYAKDSLMIISTHLISDIENIIDRAIFIKNGSIIIDDQTTTLISVHQKSLNDLFKELFVCQN